MILLLLLKFIIRLCTKIFSNLRPSVLLHGVESISAPSFMARSFNNYLLLWPATRHECLRHHGRREVNLCAIFITQRGAPFMVLSESLCRHSWQGLNLCVFTRGFEHLTQYGDKYLAELNLYRTG